MLRFQSLQRGTASLFAFGPGEISSANNTIVLVRCNLPNFGMFIMRHDSWFKSIRVSRVLDFRLPGGSWGPWQFASGVVVKAFRLNSYNNNVNNNVINNNNNGVNFNALNTANALNSVSLTGLGSLYGGNVLRPSVIYRCDYYED